MDLISLTQYPCQSLELAKILKMDYIAQGLIETIKEIFSKRAFNPQKKEYFLINSISILCYMENEQIWPFFLETIQKKEEWTLSSQEVLKKVIPQWVLLLSGASSFQDHFWYLYKSTLLTETKKIFFQGAVLSYMRKHNKSMLLKSVVIPLEYKNEMLNILDSYPLFVFKLAFACLDHSFFTYLNDYLIFSFQNNKNIPSELLFYWFALKLAKDGRLEDHRSFLTMKLIHSVSVSLNETMQEVEFNEMTDHFYKDQMHKELMHYFGSIFDNFSAKLQELC